jgi:hypothetical protein
MTGRHVSLRRNPIRWRTGLVAAAWYLASAVVARAQEIEPRQYSNAPVGVNFLIVGYAYTDGGLPTDGSLPFENPQLETNSALLGYARAIDFWGRSGKFDASVPYTYLSGSATYQGDPLERNVDGFGDAVMRVSVNLYGAPSLRLKDFASFKQDLIVGAALQISAPVGQYDETRLVNIGTNRWFFKPSLGVSKAAGPWVLEATAAATFFTDNTDFFGGRTREQDPLYSMQAHVIRDFRPGLWASVNATYYTGGSTTIDGAARHDLQRNWRVGAYAGRRDQPPQFRQVFCQRRRLGAHRQRVPVVRRGMAVPLGRRGLIAATLPRALLVSFAQAPRAYQSAKVLHGTSV